MAGDNVLAVEVHNYKALSPDITFGSALSYTAPYNPKTSLGVAYSNGTITLSWSGTGFTLQRASSPAGPWLDVPGPVVTSPYTTPNSGSTRFFRLRK